MYVAAFLLAILQDLQTTKGELIILNVVVVSQLFTFTVSLWANCGLIIFIPCSPLM